MKLKIIIFVLLSLYFSGCGSSKNRTLDINSSQTAVERPNSNENNETNSSNSSDVNKTIDIDNFINDENCDQVLEKEFSTGALLSICYDYTLKSAKYVAYTLDGELINEVNLDERPQFYREPEIPREYQILYSDYTGSGYDRGHLAPDADFDYNEEDLKIIYTLANIIPQDPNVNRYFWIKAEYQERLLAASMGELSVINGVVFDKEPKTIGKNEIAVPKAFWKIFYNDENDFRQCYYYDNFVLFDADKDRLPDHLIDCNKLILD